ncbi:MAG: trypsin-like peptidase domain-containing protein [Gemmataceae bacterium]
MNRNLVIALCLVLGLVGGYIGHTWIQGQGPATGTLPRELTSYREIVKRVLPAVVSIEAVVEGGAGGKVGRRRPEDMQLPSPPRFEIPGPDEGENPNRVGFGSGFFIDPKGVLVTNNHVVEGADTVIVRLKDGRTFRSSKLFRDPKTDLAVVRLDVKEAVFPVLSFGDSESMEIGDRVLAVGAPFGLTGTVTHGIISSVGRSMRLNMYEDFLQTDAAINPGNSGGPLVNLEGKVIGVNSAIKSRSGGFQGIGLAISSNLAKRIVAALLKDGVVRRGYLGIGIRDLDAQRATALGIKESTGVEVTWLYADAPGEKAGLKVGDIILRLDGKPVRDGRELQLVTTSLPLGKPVEVEILRGGKLQRLAVTIEEQPQTFGTARPGTIDPDRGALTIDSCGLAVNELTPELSAALNFPETARGGLIVRMKRSGLAALAGLQPGMLIVSVDGKRVNTARAAAEALKAGSVERGIVVEAQPAQGLVRSFTLRLPR